MGISLSKGQKISLDKEGGSGLERVVMGLGWDAVEKKGFLGFGGGQQTIDLDASCILFDAQKQPVDLVYFGKLRSNCSSVLHQGDNRTGQGDGDDEQIIVNLKDVPDNVASLVFVVNSFTGQTFSQIKNAFCRIFNHANNVEIAKYDLSAQGNHTAQIMCKVYRHNGEWKMHAIGESCAGATPDQLINNAILQL